MKKTQVSENSTASSAPAFNPNANELGFSYDNIPEEESIQLHDYGPLDLDELKFKFGQDEEQGDLFNYVLEDQLEDFFREETSQIDFQDAEADSHETPQSASHSAGDHPSSRVSSRRPLNRKQARKQPARPREKERILQQNWQHFFKKFKKNVNMPKAIGRYLMDHYHHFKDELFRHQLQFFEELSLELEEMKAWIKRSKKHSFKLQHLKHFFSNPLKPARYSALCRLMMRKILQRCLRGEIIPNNQVKDKLEYLVSTKVYNLRCANQRLSTRMQMR